MPVMKELQFPVTVRWGGRVAVAGGRDKDALEVATPPEFPRAVSRLLEPRGPRSSWPPRVTCYALGRSRPSPSADRCR